jgi:hypothetical protein
VDVERDTTVVIKTFERPEAVHRLAAAFTGRRAIRVGRRLLSERRLRAS